MSAFADYEAYDALGLAELVRQRKVAPAELLEAAIERVEARNTTVNAVTMRLDDLARKTIAQGLPAGPFTGVPFLVKDLTASIAGVRMYPGSTPLTVMFSRANSSAAVRISPFMPLLDAA